MNRPLIYFTLSIIIFSGCTSRTTIYDSDAALSRRSVKSKVTDLQVYIPRGWFFSKAEKDNLIDIWLIRDDYAASMIFSPVNLDNSDLSPDNISLNRIFELIKVKTEAEGNSIVNPREKLIFNGNSLLAFEFTNPKVELSRNIVFPFDGVIYQCRAIVLNSDADPDDIFSIQNSVLKSAFSFK